ncbi:hypothetical protein niasHT_008896 [Heterodera trifolii]|uniref:28S ribosomal protein S2, mitochondrial n=1 Tax=Heterodera trifolii TaxID=157864 RepID=A0ABD2LXZ0_9BILA
MTDCRGMASVPMAFEQKVPMAQPQQSMAHLPDIQTLRKGKVSPTIFKPYIDPTLCSSDPNSFESEVTVGRMFDARVHLGHKVGTLNDNMKWALYGERLGICVFDLEITRHYLLKALEFVRSVAFLGGRFLFVSTNKSSMLTVETMADELGQYAHTRHWQPGTFTNTKSVFGGPIRLPDIVILLNTLTSAMEAHPALVDSAKMCIPTVAIVDSNSEPNYVCYPIPGNDDSVESVNFFMEMFAKAIRKGRAESDTFLEGAKEKKQQQKRTMGQRRH